VVDFETLVHTVQPGDQGVTYILQEQYPDLFPPVGSPEWAPIYEAFKNNPELLQRAEFPNSDIDLIIPAGNGYPGDQFRADIFAEYYLNNVAGESTRAAYLAAHPELTTVAAAVETTPAPTVAPAESLRPELRPVDSTATENTPTESLRPEQQLSDTSRAETNTGIKQFGDNDITYKESGIDSQQYSEPVTTQEVEPQWNQQTAPREAVVAAQDTYKEIDRLLGNRFVTDDPELMMQIQDELVGWAAQEAVSDPELLQARAENLFLRSLLPDLMPPDGLVSSQEVAETLTSPLWDVPMPELFTAAQPGQLEVVQALQLQLNELGAMPFSSFQGTLGEFIGALFKSIDTTNPEFINGIRRLSDNQ
jgi:hypothetical protein